MIGLGTIINAAAIIVGGIFGALFGKFIPQRLRETLQLGCGVSVMFVAISGAMEKMLTVSGDGLAGRWGLYTVLCIALGGIVGELLNLDGLLERFGIWLRKKTGNEGDRGFVGAFVDASLTVCIGAMAIVGSIEDGISGDFSILATKSVLDFVMIMVLTCSLGRGAIFSAIPVFILQGSVTLLARLIAPLISETMLAPLSLVGSVLIFCVGLNLVFDKKIRVSNLLPALIFAIAFAFLPFPIP